jgi:hypothetical protein
MPYKLLRSNEIRYNNEWLNESCMGGSVRSICEGVFPALAWRDWGKSWKIQSQYPVSGQNSTSQMRVTCSMIVGKWVVRMWTVQWRAAHVEPWGSISLPHCMRKTLASLITLCQRIPKITEFFFYQQWNFMNCVNEQLTSNTLRKATSCKRFYL